MRSRDYEEFIEFLNQLDARYLVVGAHAVAYHARPRATKDLDIFIEPTRENAERVLDAIRQFLGTDDDLIQNKTSAGRDQDKADLRVLRRVGKKGGRA